MSTSPAHGSASGPFASQASDESNSSLAKGRAPAKRSLLRRLLRRACIAAVLSPALAVLAFFALDWAFPFPKELLAAPPKSPSLLMRIYPT